MLRPLFFSALLLSGATVLFAQSLTSAPSFEVSNSASFISVQDIAPAEGDFNQDGKPDFVLVGNTNTNNSVNLVLGNGDGTFQKPLVVGNANSFIEDMAVADFNNDGHLDIVTFDTNNNFSVFYGNGNGTFQAPRVFTTSAYPVSGTTGTFFKDGYIDIALADSNGEIEVYRNEGGKNFVLISTVQAASGTSGFNRVRGGNINGNGISDLAALSYTGAYVLWNNGQGAFSKVLLSSYTTPEDLNIGNVNQDGRADILVSYSCAQTSSGGVGKGNGSTCTGIDVYYGQGNNRTFFRHAITDADLSQASSLQAVDVNGDGIADLAASANNITNSTDGLYVWLGNPDGSFSQTPQIFNVGDNGGMVAADFNRDGAMDFVQHFPANGTLETFINGGQHGPCQTSAVTPTVTVCQPVDNTYVQPVINVQATAFDKNKITGLQEYVDGNLDYSEDVTRLDYTSPALSLGPHSLVTKAWDYTGLSFISPRTVTVYSGTPGLTCPAAAGTANICMPSSAIASSPVLILANGSTPNIPTAAQLYIDGKLVVNNTAAGTSLVQTMQTLPVGSHYLVFKLYDSQGNAYTAEKTIDVR